MDDIFDFEALVAGSPQVKREPDADTASFHTPTKRGSETHSSAVPSEQPQSRSFKRRRSAKLELGDEDDPEGAVACDPACLGCGRGKRSGVDFLDGSRPVAWAFPDGRGHWCKDCHSTWRTAFSGSHTLPLFGAWLRVPDNLRAFQAHVLAYVTLMHEDKKHITAGMIAERTSTISLTLRLLGIPMEPCVMLLLEDAIGVHPPMPLPSDLNPNHFVTVRMLMGDRIALMVPDRIDPLCSTAISRPASTDGPLFGNRAFLSTGSTADQEFLAEKFDAKAPPNGTASSPCAVAPIGTDAVRPQLSKMEARLDVLTVTSTTIVDAFSMDQWELLKESSFTKVVRDLAQFKSQAESEADVPTIEKSDLWLAGMLAGKRFVKAYKDYIKCKAKFNRLVELAVPMRSFRTFLVDTAKRSIASSFELLYHKATFLCNFEKSHSLSSAIETMVKDGAPEVFAKAQADEDRRDCSRFSGEIWLRGVVLHVLGMMFQEAAGGTTGERVIALHVELRSSRDSLQEHETFAKHVQGVIDDLNSLTLVLGCAAGYTNYSGTALNTAVKRLNSEHFAAFTEVVKECEVYKTATAAASTALQVSSKDGIADDKFDRAMAILLDCRQPHLANTVVDDGDALMFENFGCVQDMSVVDSLDESMTKICEATKMWSPLRAEQKTSEIGKWAAEVVKQVSMYDAGLTLFSFATLQSGGATCLQDAATDDGAIVWPDAKTLAALATCIENHCVDEHPLVDFTSRFTAFLQGLPPHFSHELQMHQHSQVLQAFRENSSTRSKITEALLAVVDITEGPSTTEAAVDDFLAKHTIGKYNDALLFKVSQFLLKVFQLDGHPMRDTQHGLAPTDMVIIPASEGDVEASTWPRLAMGDASKITLRITEMKLVNMLKIFVQDSMQPVFDRFADSLHLAGIQPTPRPDLVKDGDLSGHLSCFFIQPRMAEHLLAIGKTFLTKGAKAWDCDSLRSLCETLAGVLPDVTFSVSLHAFCRQEVTRAPRCASKAAVIHLSKVFAMVWKAAGTFAFVEKHLSSQDGVVRDHILKSEVEAAATFARSCIISGIELINDNKINLSKAIPVAAYTIELGMLRAWFEQAWRVASEMCKGLQQIAVHAALELSLEVEKMTPRFKHFITETTINTAMVRRHILGSPHRATLGEKSVALFASITSATALQSHWLDAPAGLAADAKTGPSSDDAVVEGDASDKLTTANDIFGQAKQAIVIVGVCKVIFEMTGTEQKAQAGQLLDTRGAALPDSLVSLLEKKAGRAAGSTPRPARAGVSAATPDRADASVAPKPEAEGAEPAPLPGLAGDTTT